MSASRKIMINNLECFIDINNSNNQVLFHWMINNVYKFYSVRMMNVKIIGKTMTAEINRVVNEIVNLNDFDYNLEIPNYDTIDRKVLISDILNRTVELDLFNVLANSIILEPALSSQGAVVIEEIWRRESDWKEYIQENIIFTDDFPVKVIVVATGEQKTVLNPLEIRQPFYMNFNFTEPSTVGGNDGVIEIIDQWGGQTPYLYRLQEGVAGTSGLTAPYQTSPIFTGLLAGTYNVQMIDGDNNESLVREIILKDPADTEVFTL